MIAVFTHDRVFPLGDVPQQLNSAELSVGDDAAGGRELKVDPVDWDLRL